jgi:transcription termination/antitermination protein NusG
VLNWHALWTRSRHEQLVCRELVTKQIESFLPTIPRWRSWKDRRKKVEWPLFPGYCFARFDDAERFRVLNCAGVVRVVSFGREPAVVPDQDIEGIRRLVESDLQYDPCPFIHEGAMVEVVHGPLAGLIGRLLRKGAHAHLVLSVESVNQSVSVQVDAGDVAPLESSAGSNWDVSSAAPCVHRNVQ